MLTDALLASIRRRARLPIASALGAQDSDLLAMCDEETDHYIVPLVLQKREDYWLTTEDIAVAPGASYRIPYRAIGARLREVSFLDSQSQITDPPRIPIDDLEGRDYGFYLQGSEFVFANPLDSSSLPVSVRFWYYLRPNRLVLAAAAATIASLDRAARTVTLASVPSGYAGRTSFDLLRARPSFDTLAWDATGTLSGSTVTFASDLPADLAVGDYVCLPEQTPVPQMPPELHPLLAQRVACKWLEVNDPQGYETAAAELQRMEGTLAVLIGSRVEGEPQGIVRSNALW